MYILWTRSRVVVVVKLKDFEASLSAAQIEKLRLRRHELEEENDKLKASVPARPSEEIARLEDLRTKVRAREAADRSCRTTKMRGSEAILSTVVSAAGTCR
jgi:cell division protein FtsB